MSIELFRIDDAFKMEARNVRGNTMILDAGVSTGGTDDGWRPMETLLVSLAGCSAIDVILILKKQRQRIDKFKIEINGDRVEGTPSPFKRIELHFKLEGEIKPEKIEQAIELTKSKYCSVLFSLHPDIQLDYLYTIE